MSGSFVCERCTDGSCTKCVAFRECLVPRYDVGERQPLGAMVNKSFLGRPPTVDDLPNEIRWRVTDDGYWCDERGIRTLHKICLYCWAIEGINLHAPKCERPKERQKEEVRARTDAFMRGFNDIMKGATEQIPDPNSPLSRFWARYEQEHPDDFKGLFEDAAPAKDAPPVNVGSCAEAINADIRRQIKSVAEHHHDIGAEPITIVITATRHSSSFLHPLVGIRFGVAGGPVKPETELILDMLRASMLSKHETIKPWISEEKADANTHPSTETPAPQEGRRRDTAIGGRGVRPRED